MNPEEKEMLQNVSALTEENNKLLHKIRGVQRRATIWGTIKILVIIAIALGSFYYIEPYLNKIMDLYSSVSGIEQNVKSVSDPSFLQDLLKKL